MITVSKLNAITLLLALALPVTAQVFKETGPEGKVIFTDQPSPEAKPVEVPDTNTAKAIPIPGKTPIQSQAEEAAYQRLLIIDPQDGSIIPNGPGHFSVQVKLTPALQEDHQIRLLLNGENYQQGQNSQFELRSVPRGRHELTAQVVDKENTVLISSQPASVQVYRPSNSKKK